MATRTIASPGVQINELDLSIIARPTGGTNVFMAGFTPQGPTDEIINVGSVIEFEDVFGQPENAAERYLYHSAKQVLNNNGNLLVSRLPYGSEEGTGFSNSYSALVYPIEAQVSTSIANLSSYNGTIALSSGYSALFTANLSSYNGTIALSSANNIEFYPIFTGIYTELPKTRYKSTSRSISAIYNNTIVNVVTGYDIDTNVLYPTFPVFLGTYTTINTSSNFTNEVADVVYENTIVTVLTGINSLTNSPVSYDDADILNIKSPYSILLDQSQYESILEGDIDWSLGYDSSAINSFTDINKSGIIVINSAKTTLNDLFEGYYLAFADNSNINPSTNFDSISSIQAYNQIISEQYQLPSTVPASRFSFRVTALSGSYGTGSISETIESLPTQFDFSGKEFNDSLVCGLFKIRSSIYNRDTVTLDYVLSEGYTGSLYHRRTQNDPNGGTPKTFFIEDQVNQNSPNIKILVNPNISNSGKWTSSNGLPSKKVNVDTSAKNAYSVGVYKSESNKNTKDIGNVPKKLERALRNLEVNDDIVVDIVTESGLGTIWTGKKARVSKHPTEGIFDDTFPVNIDILYTNDNTIVAGVRDDYLSVVNQFISFSQQVRKDHIFLADGLRYIYVSGKDYKITKRKDFIFSNNIYWPLKNLFAGIETSYASVYGNWLKTNDSASDSQVWVPPSGFVAGNMAASDRINYPWSAPAGFNRGTLVGVTDIGVISTQKQRDLLYKININPIAFFPADGFVVYGQKTLYKKPSAFDRINVRRLFLFLEKATQGTLKFFLFEPNSISTRTRLVGAISPIFEQAKVNDGIYNYQIICDERNNTPDVIDNNELKVSIYIQPVRTAEFILADFIATRTGIDFQEIIG